MSSWLQQWEGRRRSLLQKLVFIIDRYFVRSVEGLHCPFQRCIIGSYHAFTVRINKRFILELLNNVSLLFNIGYKKLQQYLDTYFLYLQFSIVMLLLLLETGDDESNPGTFCYTDYDKECEYGFMEQHNNI